MQDLVYYSPQHDGIVLNEDGKLQSMVHCNSIRRNNCSKQSLMGSSTVSSMVSDVSSCAMISPPGSFHNGLRRSTFDLSEYDSATGTYRKDRGSTLRQRSFVTNGAATQALLDLNSSKEENTSRQSLFSSSTWNKAETMYSNNDDAAATPQPTMLKENQKRGESIIEDVFWGYISLLLLVVNMERQVRNLCREIQSIMGYAWEVLRANSFQCEEPLERRVAYHKYDFPSNKDIPSGQETMKEQEGQDVGDEQTKELLTPLKLVTTDYTETSLGKDEWGHFADFQDELADESSFIPSCCHVPPPRSSLKKGSSFTLAPLAEVQEGEADDEEDWSF
ncbi:hypothetical protein IV203_011857 [Nitzschia inconspicua]|uniref:Uncharacterized protein n=1 Tax=Nitzschia inconspicua TaxID=303405 RepID=A0A9K3KU67_9STRA|nr:hypothetical protein IV203_011857 [Nitzschia inconspicua]